MNLYLTPEIPYFFVASLRNRQLLRRMTCASNLNILDRNLFVQIHQRFLVNSKLSLIRLGEIYKGLL